MNYGEIKTHFEALLNRSDNTTALTETFIEQGMTRLGRQLRTPMQERVKKYNFASATSEVVLPNDFLQLISLYYDKTELIRVPMSRYRELDDGATGKPTVFTRQAEELLLDPVPTTGTLFLYYYAAFPRFTSDTDTTTLGDVAPDALIYSALTYAADYYLDSRQQLFETKLSQFMTELQEQSNDQELNAGGQSIQPSFRYSEDL